MNKVFILNIDYTESYLTAYLLDVLVFNNFSESLLGARLDYRQIINTQRRVMAAENINH